MEVQPFLNQWFPAKDEVKFIDAVNHEILQLTQLQHVPLGPTYKTLTGSEVRENLTIHRMCKKFERPELRDANDRKIRSISDVLRHDSQGLPFYGTFSPHASVTCPEVKKVLYKARVSLQANIHKYFRIDPEMLMFPSGETLVSAHKKVDLQYKLHNLSQWCITQDALPFFYKLAHKHRALKKMVKQHWYNKVRYDFGPTRQSDVRRRERDLWFTYGTPSSVFNAKVDLIVTIVEGARFSTVSKNNEMDRVIECEAMLNMICQRVIAFGIQRVLRLGYGIIVTIGQDIHKALIQGPVDTTDLRNASNSIWLQVCDFFLGGTELGRLVHKTRSPQVDVDDVTYLLNMVAPMGNGFTFELMTLLLLAICREVDENATVYGDDIITHKGTDLVHASLLAIGVNLNTEKTFVDSPFRESCGGFYHDDIGYIESFEFEWAEDLYDAIVLVNKMKIILGNLQQHERVVSEAYHRLLRLAPSLCLVPGTPRRDTLDEGVFVSKTFLRKVHSNLDPALRAEIAPARTSIVSRFHLHKEFVFPCVKVEKKNVKRCNAPLHVRDASWLYYYLYNGRRLNPEKREQRVKRTLTLCSDSHQTVHKF
nr:MAG: RNA-dependent RNA polymerase [Riboviria sp.]